MIYHIFHIKGVHKFLPLVIDLFSKYDNYFVFIKRFDDEENSLLMDVLNTRLLNKNYSILAIKDINNFSRKINEKDIVIIHYLDFANAHLIEKIGTKRIAWLTWGPDVTTLISFKDKWFSQNYYTPLSKELFKELKYKNKPFKKLKGYIINALPGFVVIFYFSFRNRKLISVLKKIKYIAPAFPMEYDLLKKHYKKIKIKDLQFSYISLKNVSEYYNQYCIDKSNRGNNILVGHSAYNTGNHLDAYYLLKSFTLKNIKVFSILSYGDEQYKNALISRAKKILGNSFVPITNYFTNVNDYYNILLSCSAIIINSKKQEGSGLIINCLYLGLKVFLRNENPIYNFLLSNDIYVYSIEKDLKTGDVSTFQLLSEEKQIHNRTILKKIYSPEVIQHKTDNLVETLMKM